MVGRDKLAVVLGSVVDGLAQVSVRQVLLLVGDLDVLLHAFRVAVDIPHSDVFLLVGTEDSVDVLAQVFPLAVHLLHVHAPSRLLALVLVLQNDVLVLDDLVPDQVDGHRPLRVLVGVCGQRQGSGRIPVP